MDAFETAAHDIESFAPTNEKEPSQQIRIIRAGNTIRVGGEVDLGSAPVLSQALAGCRADPELVLDLREVTFMDSSGIHVLLDLVTARRELPFTILPSRPVLTVLKICGLDAMPAMLIRPLDA